MASCRTGDSKGKEVSRGVEKVGSYAQICFKNF
jgi:hypothetical protein